MRKILKSRFFIVSASLVLALSTLALLASFTNSISPVRAAALDAVQPGQSFFSGVFDKINVFFSAYTRYEKLAEENEALRMRITELEGELMESMSLSEENKTLRQLLSLEEESENMSYLPVRITASPRRNVYTLDKGSLDGVKTGMAVVTADGLAGFIRDVSLKSATVCALTSVEAACSVRVSRSACTGIAQGSYEFESNGLLRLSYLEKDADVLAGDVAETTGGDVCPSGIAIGIITDTALEEHALSAYAVIKPFAKLEGETRVFIITAFTEER